MKIRDPKERVPISEGQMADWVEEVVSEWGGDHLSTEGRNKLASVSPIPLHIHGCSLTSLLAGDRNS
jgi:hypothetical protein